MNDFSLNLLATFILTGLIGVEREINGSSGGLRTHILVGLGTLGMMAASFFMASQLNGSLDPTRIAGSIIQGIGFLGAGSILKSKGSVSGLTTASSIWAVCGIAILCSLGMFKVATIITFSVLFTLTILRWAEWKMDTKKRRKSK